MSPRLKTENGRLTGKKAQVSLEIALTLICVLLLLMGSFKIFMWVNQLLVLRQEDYEETRAQAGSSSQGVEVDEATLPRLNIFGTAQN